MENRVTRKCREIGADAHGFHDLTLHHKDEVLTQSTDYWLGLAERARRKKFGGPAPASRDDWNRQARFLAQRGFPADLIYRVLGGIAD